MNKKETFGEKILKEILEKISKPLTTNKLKELQAMSKQLDVLHKKIMNLEK